jgi:hypothetical protein
MADERSLAPLGGRWCFSIGTVLAEESYGRNCAASAFPPVSAHERKPMDQKKFLVIIFDLRRLRNG